MLIKILPIYCFKRLILFFILLFGVVSFSYAQNNFSYQDYFPKEKVDSVEWYYGDVPSKKDSTKHLLADGDIYTRDEVFPFDDLTILLESYFEKRAVLKDASDIQQLIQVFPTNSCETYAVTRCGAVYRDILVFCKDGVPISVLKICFSCKATSFVSSNGEEDKNAKCLSNPLSLKEIAKEWIRRGWIDLFLIE